MSGQRGGILFRLLALVAIAGFAAILYLAWHPLLRAAASFWIVQDRIEPADIIIVIGDDDFTADRAKEAAALFRAGWAPQILASGRMLRPYASIADYMARDLQSDGVPPSAILRFSHRADDTREEAEGLRLVAEQKGWRRILLVTSNYHTRRARYIFRKVLPASVHLEVASAPDSEFDPATWWESRPARKRFFLETVGYLQAIWELNRPLSGTPAASWDPEVNSLALLTGRSPKSSKMKRFSVYIDRILYYSRRPSQESKSTATSIVPTVWGEGGAISGIPLLGQLKCMAIKVERH